MVTVPGSAATASAAADSKKADSPTKTRKELRLNMFMFILPFSPNLLDAARDCKATCARVRPYRFCLPPRRRSTRFLESTKTDLAGRLVGDFPAPKIGD